VRRIRLTTGPTALFLALFVAALIVFMPLRLALGWFGFGDQGLTARSVSGTIWGGRLTQARFGDLGIGDLSAGLSPWPLFVGRARVDLAAREGSVGPRLTGAVGVTRHSFGVDDLTASLPTGRIFAPLPVTALDLEEASARFTDGACERAEGRVRATLSGDVSGIAVPPTLSGTMRCDGEALLIPLASAAGTEGSTVRLFQDGRYRADLTLNPSDPAAGEKLRLAGFGQTGQGWQLSIDGRF
jgi:general secretion pathway protein N